jgi:hypothetical protein
MNRDKHEVYLKTWLRLICNRLSEKQACTYGSNNDGTRLSSHFWEHSQYEEDSWCFSIGTGGNPCLSILILHNPFAAKLFCLQLFQAL